APALALETEAGATVVLPGPPGELQRLWPAALDAEPVRRVLARAQEPERRVLRFYGASESEIARSLAESGGDGDGVDVTICAREFEIHVDLFVGPGGEARADAIEAGLVAGNDAYLFSRDERPTAELLVDELRGRGLTLGTAESCTGGLVAA